MSRPKILSATGASVKVEVPPGWYANLSAISRKTHNQLIEVNVEVEGQILPNLLAGVWGKANQPMQDIDSPSDTISIKSQPKTFTIQINSYFSTNAKIKEDELINDKYRSAQVNILGTQRPPKPPAGFPDYSTFLLFVEDTPPEQRVQGAPEFDDSLVTLNIIQGVVPSAPPDTSTAALTQTGKDAVLGWIDIVTDPTKPGPTIDPGTLEPNKPFPVSPYPVGIIGAGISGLYMGLMLDSLGIKYEILEGSSRVGGRLYTHNFPKNSGKYQYYDVGAMRYPDTTFMARTFKLKDRMGLKMLDYIRGNDNAFMCFNGISVTKAELAKATASNLTKKEDVFKVTEANDGQIPDAEYQKGSGYFWDVILDEFRQYFVKLPFDQAFKKLKEKESHSVRSYLLVEKKIPYPVVDWYEKMESRTGLFDLSLTETVLASLVFNDPNKPPGTKVPWYCFDGGSEVLHKAVQEKLSVKPQLYMRAIDIREADNGASIEVEFDSRANPRPSAQGRSKKKFSNVISTMSFGCLRLVNLDHLYLSYPQKNAIRTLMYTPSIKIGVQFKTAWWEKKCNIEGGQSSTDRPIRDMVYPSYGPDDSHPGSKKSNCMIASYSGMQDSQRMGGLMKGKGTPEENTMLDLVMRDLAAVHKVDVEELWNEYEDYYPWDFHRDEFQLGAFCQFGPGQFEHVYPHVCQPGSKQQRFYFAGDACSTFHGWVAGALNSAWRAVLQMLMAHPELNPNPGQDIIAKFKAEWGDSEEWDQRDLAKITQLNAKLAQMNLQP